MPNRPPDYTPASPPAAPASRRGGARPGAGAPKGNLNALRHGRRSRFRDLMQNDTDAVAVAGRLLAKERRVAERHATTLLRLALLARHRQEYAAAVAEGRPLPQPPLLDLPDIEVDSLMRYLDRVGQRARDERARRDGALTADASSVTAACALAGSLDDLVRLAASELDHAVRSLPSPAALAALLDTASSGAFNQPHNQPESVAADSHATFVRPEANPEPAGA